MGVQNATASASCVTVLPKEKLVESTIDVAFKYNAFLFAYGALSVNFDPLPRYHNCGDYKHGVALPLLVRLGCSTCSTTIVKVTVVGRARPAVGACLVLGNTEVRSANSSYFLHRRRPRMVDCGTFG